MSNKDKIAKRELSINESVNSASYLQEFLQKAYGQNLIDDAAAESIQYQFYELLAKQMERYTCGNSSSVSEKIAAGLQQSIFFTIGIYLKKLPDTGQRIGAIAERTLSSLHQDGKKTISELYDQSKKMLKIIQDSRFPTDNIAYNDTVYQGIPEFFSFYDRDYFAHDTPGSIDYPLYGDPMELTGVEYIYDYLNQLFLENTFCELFPENDRKKLLQSYSFDHKELLINHFTLILTNAIGSALSEKSNVSLAVEPSDRLFLQETLSDLPKEELTFLLNKAVKTIVSKLEIKDSKLIYHMKSAAADLLPRLKNALENCCLQTLFLTLAENPATPCCYPDQTFPRET